ncbi:hypothetical protein [Pedobacter frigidisoli]|nr:hypothetical protein [Pedobacter frigidisoli]
MSSRIEKVKMVRETQTMAVEFENYKATNDLVNWLIKQVPGKK